MLRSGAAECGFGILKQVLSSPLLPPQISEVCISHPLLAALPTPCVLLQRFQILQHGLTGPKGTIKLLTHACLLLHNFCVTRRAGAAVDVHTSPHDDNLEAVLDYQEAQRGATALDNLMTEGADELGAPVGAEEEELRNVMLSNATRQQIIARAGWQHYQRAVTPDRRRRRALVAAALEYEAHDAAEDRRRTALARREMQLKSQSRRPGKRQRNEVTS